MRIINGNDTLTLWQIREAAQALADRLNDEDEASVYKVVERKDGKFFIEVFNKEDDFKLGTL